ncbi:MAG: RidA family protein, partial [Hyphomicrobium sp.]|nr:RidA family protein [Hyphomicrobium sp.]
MRALLAAALMAVGGTAFAAPPVYHPSDYPFPFSDAVQVGDLLILSGQIGAKPGTTSVVPGGIEPETRQVLANIDASLKRRGLAMDSVVKCTVMLADMKDWPAFNKIYATYFQKGRYPARSALGVNGLALGAKIEL